MPPVRELQTGLWHWEARHPDLPAREKQELLAVIVSKKTEVVSS
jgi:hypothetical protein